MHINTEALWYISAARSVLRKNIKNLQIQCSGLYKIHRGFKEELYTSLAHFEVKIQKHLDNHFLGHEKRSHAILLGRIQDTLNCVRYWIYRDTD